MIALAHFSLFNEDLIVDFFLLSIIGVVPVGCSGLFLRTIIIFLGEISWSHFSVLLTGEGGKRRTSHIGKKMRLLTA